MEKTIKKIISLIISTILITSIATSATAKVGDINGMALNTDIVAYINHYAIPSYALNGQSVIVAEDLTHFGFDVLWNNTDKSLHISRNTKTQVQPMNVNKSDIPNTFFANTLETDIRVYAQDKQLTSYAINGYTMIPIEELGIFGSITWSAEERAIKLWIDGLHTLTEKQPVTITNYTLYNLNQEEISVLPAEVEAYKAAGWYTYNDFICEWANKLAKEQGYAAAAEYLSTKLYSNEFNANNPTTQRQWDTLNNIYKYWYGEIGIPIVITDSYIGYNSIDTPQANISLWNISGKDIDSFELEFVCYDAYGNVTSDYSWYNGSYTGWMDNAQLSHGEESYYYWTLYSNTRTRSVRNIRITKVAFSDGTYWYR